MRRLPLFTLLLCALTAPVLAVDLPGKRPDGSVLLPNQWALRPAGEQIALGDFPVNLALHPAGRFAAVLHCGYSAHEIVVLDLARRAIVSREKIAEAFYGLAFSKDGTRLFCSGSSDETVHEFTFMDGQLSDHTALPLRDPRRRGIPAGLAVSGDARTIYAANLWGQSVSRVRIPREGPASFDELILPEPTPVPAGQDPASSSGTPGQSQESSRPKQGSSQPDASAAPASTDDPSITKRELQLLDHTDPHAPFPYACALDEKRERLYVSLWAQASLAVIDTKTFTLTARWTTEAHPSEMLLNKSGRLLYVANANRNTVSVIDTTDGRTVETLLAELVPGAPPGNTPNSLALSPDGAHLFVANANIDTVAVFDVSTSGKSRSLGFIPVGWYPTSVRVTPDGKSLLVVNGKGETSKANPEGPQPGQKSPAGKHQYIGELMNGTLSVIPLPAPEKLEAQMKKWTAIAYACSPETERKLSASDLAGNPIPLRPGDPTPLKYVIYIIKENRTYDQVLGDMKEGNGDPALCLFPEAVTPNHHALAGHFVLLDNMYVDAEVSADGHEWSMGAYATDFVEKTWPLSYGHGKGGKFPYPSEGGFPIATPAGGYLWDRARAAGVSYRSYGEWVANGRTPADPCRAKTKALEGHFDPWFHSFDTSYRDQKRADRFIAELKRFESEGEMPRLQIVRLPNDHTSGTSPGKPTPTAQVADNDLALGRVVEAISRSRFWSQTAVFVIEDDAQNGPDHVDAHRTISFAFSPYIRRGSVDSTMYSTSSLLRTIELILGLKPMSQFDATAMPMFASFQKTPDLTPYTVRPISTDLEQTNMKTAWGGKASQRMDFTKEDAADDQKLNEIIWRSVRGAASPMPAPRRAAFVFTQPQRSAKEDD